MVRIAISQAAFEAIVKTMSLGSVGFEREADANDERLIWIERFWRVSWSGRLFCPRRHRRWTHLPTEGVLSEVRAQAHHDVSEIAHVSALFCPGQVFVPALHLAIFRVQPAVDQPSGRLGGWSSRINLYVKLTAAPP